MKNLFAFCLITLALFSCKKEEEVNEAELVSDQIVGVWESGTKRDFEETGNGSSSKTTSITQFDFETAKDLYAKVCFSPGLNCTWSCTANTVNIIGLTEFFDEYKIVSISADKFVFEGSSVYTNSNNQTVTKTITFTLYRAQNPWVL